MRSLVFLVSFVLSMAVFRATGETNVSFAVWMSVCTAAIVCTVATRSGRVAARRIVRGSTQGWGRRS